MTQRRAVSFDSTVSTRVRLLAPAAFAAALLLPTRTLVRAQDGEAAAALLEQAATTMAGLESCAFHLTTIDGETRFVEGITLREVTGAVQRPDRFTATAEFDLMIATIEITIVSRDGRLWFTNPFGEGFQEIDLGEFGAFDPTVVINPDRLLLPALSTVDDPTIVGLETLEDGTVTTRIDGTVDLGAVAGVEGSPGAEEAGFSFPESLPFSVWIDAESIVRRIQVVGPILPEEEPGIIRRVDLLAFNEPVDIQVPS